MSAWEIMLGLYLFLGWLIFEGCTWAQRGKGARVDLGAALWIILGWPVVVLSLVLDKLRGR